MVLQAGGGGDDGVAGHRGARVKREAFRRGCAILIIDTIRAWCPQAEHSNTHAAQAMSGPPARN